MSAVETEISLEGDLFSAFENSVAAFAKTERDTPEEVSAIEVLKDARRAWLDAVSKRVEKNPRFALVPTQLSDILIRLKCALMFTENGAHYEAAGLLQDLADELGQIPLKEWGALEAWKIIETKVILKEAEVKGKIPN